MNMDSISNNNAIRNIYPKLLTRWHQQNRGSTHVYHYPAILHSLLVHFPAVRTDPQSMQKTAFLTIAGSL
jgi:hypothetical protein